MPLRLAALEPPSKSYSNRIVQSFFVQLSRNRGNKPRSVEEGRSLLGGTHAMKSVKPSLDILEGLSTGVNMDVSAPHLIHK